MNTSEYAVNLAFGVARWGPVLRVGLVRWGRCFVKLQAPLGAGIQPLAVSATGATPSSCRPTESRRRAQPGRWRPTICASRGTEAVTCFFALGRSLE